MAAARLAPVPFPFGAATGGGGAVPVAVGHGGTKWSWRALELAAAAEVGLGFAAAGTPAPAPAVTGTEYGGESEDGSMVGGRRHARRRGGNFTAAVGRSRTFWSDSARWRACTKFGACGAEKSYAPEIFYGAHNFYAPAGGEKVAARA